MSEPSKFFQQKPVELQPKPLVPDGTDLNSVTDSVHAGQAALVAENKKNLDAFLARELEIKANIFRAEMADEAERNVKAEAAEKKRLWHEGNARDAREKEARKKAARQLALKTKLSTLAAANSEAIAIIDELEDKNCAQVKFLCESASELIRSITPS